MGKGLISQIAPGQLVVTADRSGEAFAQYLVKFKARNFTIARASGPDISLSDAVALGQIFVCHNTGAGEAVDIFFGSSALLGIVQGGVNLLRSIDQVAQFGWVHRTGDIWSFTVAAVRVMAFQN